jgi:hypothetical protein
MFWHFFCFVVPPLTSSFLSMFCRSSYFIIPPPALSFLLIIVLLILLLLLLLYYSSICFAVPLHVSPILLLRHSSCFIAPFASPLLLLHHSSCFAVPFCVLPFFLLRRPLYYFIAPPCFVTPSISLFLHVSLLFLFFNTLKDYHLQRLGDNL